MASLLYKSGITPDGLAPAGRRIAFVLGRAATRFATDLTVTCTTTDHAADDPHTLGNAIDLRVRDLPGMGAGDRTMLLALRSWLREQLGPEFTVLYEAPTAGPDVDYVNAGATAPHLHLQLKKGLTVWTGATDPAASSDT